MALAYVLVLAVVALGVPLAINLRARVSAEVRTQAQAQADLVAATAADLLGPAQRSALKTLAQTAATSVRGRILVLDAHGRVLADSTGPAELGANYASRPEIAAALAGRQVQVQRSSQTLGEQILATAVPIIRNGRPVGAARVTQSVSAVGSAVNRAEIGVVLIGVIVLALGLLAGAIIAAQVGRPITRLDEVARHVAQGDLNARARIEGSREQRSLARSFNEMTERIGRLLAAQREFVADASHQLRTPLTAMRLRLEAAKELVRPGAAESELDAALAEVDRLAHTVNELLALSSAGGRRSAATTVDLRELAASACVRWQQTAGAGEHQLIHRHVGKAATALASREDIDRALDVLIENALRYSPPSTRVELVSGEGRIEVHDRGPGIPMEERESVFERFHRGSAGRSGPSGSGLGLAIARELMRDWRGDVTVTVREGGGTIATLSLPPLADHDARAALPSLNRERRSVA